MRAPAGGVTTASKGSGIARALWFPVRNHLVPPGRAGLLFAGRQQTGQSLRRAWPPCLGFMVPSIIYAGAPGRMQERSAWWPRKYRPCSSTIWTAARPNTVRFALDGTSYEIDLSGEHAQALRGALSRYIDAARRAPGTQRPARSRRRKPSAGDPDSTEVRDWARSQGIDVKDRGRIPAGLVVKFKAATTQ